jgi:GTP-binding protein HflX
MAISARALVVHVALNRAASSEQPERSLSNCLAEAVGLAGAIELQVVAAHLVKLRQKTPATLIGKGKIEELAAEIEAQEIALVVMDCQLSPLQQRNLEKALACKVIDRTALILEIFGARARTAEGKLQVELASLTYQKSRLVRSWTHLERQRGGFGFLGGPGESQIELDRRLISERIVKIKKQLEKVVRTRNLHRAVRRDVPYPLVAIVGYTNAGKSTLFNRLTGAEVLAKDQLFATLDPTIRALSLPAGEKIMLSDTVGFISNLPTELIAAFRATLEEVLEADIILHVRDIADPDSAAQKNDVLSVLKGLFGAEEFTQKIIEVHNKIDLLTEAAEMALPADDGLYPVIRTSAVTGDGLTALCNIIAHTLDGCGLQEVSLQLPASAGKAMAWLHANSLVLRSHSDESGMQHIKLRISAAQLQKFRNLFALS